MATDSAMFSVIIIIIIIIVGVIVVVVVVVVVVVIVINKGAFCVLCLRVRFCGVILSRINDPRSVRSWYIQGTDEFTLVTNSCALFVRHNPTDLGSMALIQITRYERSPQGEIFLVDRAGELPIRWRPKKVRAIIVSKFLKQFLPN